MIIRVSKRFKIRNIFWSLFLMFVFLLAFIFSLRVISFKTIFWFFCLIFTLISSIKTIKMVNKCQIELKDDMIVIEQVAKKFKKTNFIERFRQPFIYKYDAQSSVRDYVVILKREEILYKDIIKCDFINNLRIKVDQAVVSDLGIVTNKKSYISNFQFKTRDLELIRDKININISNNQINN